MIRFLLLCILVLTSSAALSQPWYGFIGGGSVTTKVAGDNDAEVAAQGTFLTSNDEKSAGTFRIGAGYRASRHLSWEAAFLDFGELHHYSGSFGAGANTGNLDKKWSASGLTLSALGTLPVSERFSLLGKLQAAYLKTKFSTATVIEDPNHVIVSSTSDSRRGSAIVPSIGIGMSTSALPPLEVRVLYEIFGKVGAFGDGNEIGNMRLLSVDLLFRF